MVLFSLIRHVAPEPDVEHPIETTATTENTKDGSTNYRVNEGSGSDRVEKASEDEAVEKASAGEEESATRVNKGLGGDRVEKASGDKLLKRRLLHHHLPFKDLQEHWKLPS
jgi:hypothetical protein